MSSIIASLAISMSACGDTFVSGDTYNEGGSGGYETTSVLTGTGGNNGSSTSTETGVGGSELMFTDTPVSECNADYVFVPWSGYNLNNSPAVSCITVPKDSEWLIIKDFTYNLFNGNVNVVVDMPACDAVNHSAIWFTTMLDANGKVVIPSVIDVNETTVTVDQLVWTDFVTPNFTGVTAPVNVVLPETVSISLNEAFCFGHRFAISTNNNPTCLTSCLNEINYTSHQISDSKGIPYNFNTADFWPPDGDASKHYSFASSVTGGLIP